VSIFSLHPAAMRETHGRHPVKSVAGMRGIRNL